jgi:hypothetical protein
MEELEICPFCGRPIHIKSHHHMIPKCRGGHPASKMLICRDCHSAIHALFTNRELEEKYNTVGSLKKDRRFMKAIKFLSKRDPTVRTKTKLENRQRGRKKR